MFESVTYRFFCWDKQMNKQCVSRGILGFHTTGYFAEPKEQVIWIIMKQPQGPVNNETSLKLRQLVGQAIAD